MDLAEGVDESGEDKRKQKEHKNFGGFCWCLNRKDLLVTYDHASPEIRFWNVPSEENESQMGEEQKQGLAVMSDAVSSKDNSIMQLVTEHSDDELVHPASSTGYAAGGQNWAPPVTNLSPSTTITTPQKSIRMDERVCSLQWKPRGSQKSVSDRNRFIAYLADGRIREMVFYERNF